MAAQEQHITTHQQHWGDLRSLLHRVHALTLKDLLTVLDRWPPPIEADQALLAYLKPHVRHWNPHLGNPPTPLMAQWMNGRLLWLLELTNSSPNVRAFIQRISLDALNSQLGHISKEQEGKHFYSLECGWHHDGVQSVEDAHASYKWLFSRSQTSAWDWPAHGATATPEGFIEELMHHQRSMENGSNLEPYAYFSFGKLSPILSWPELASLNLQVESGWCTFSVNENLKPESWMMVFEILWQMENRAQSGGWVHQSDPCEDGIIMPWEVWRLYRMLRCDDQSRTQENLETMA